MCVDLNLQEEDYIAMAYTIEEHKHRFAAWCAARSASASKLCRFKVYQGKEILEACGFKPAFSNPNQLPTPRNIDQKHEEWREDIINMAEKYGLKCFTHGVAAKLINCYLKTRFVCGGYHEHERVKCLHPPIDRLLLGELAKRNVGGFAVQWKEFKEKPWSRFDSNTYQSVIDQIRKSLKKNEPLWKIEEHWEGHQ